TECSEEIRRRVVKAREVQLERFRGENIYCNAQMSPRLIRKYCRVDAESKAKLENAITRLGLSARAYDRILKVSSTLADLQAKEEMESLQGDEGIRYGIPDRSYWAEGERGSGVQFVQFAHVQFCEIHHKP